MISKEKRIEKVRKKQSDLKEKLVQRAVDLIINMAVEATEWKNEIEEEINKDREREKIRENGEHILRKRKADRRLKYIKKEIGEKRKVEVNQGNRKERKRLKPRRRIKEIVTEKIGDRGGEPQSLQNREVRSQGERELIKKKRSGIKKREIKKKESLEERRKLQEGTRKWLREGGEIRSKNWASTQRKWSEKKEESRKEREALEKKGPEIKEDQVPEALKGRENRKKVTKEKEERKLRTKSLKIPNKGESYEVPNPIPKVSEVLEAFGGGETLKVSEGRVKVQKDEKKFPVRKVEIEKSLGVPEKGGKVHKEKIKKVPEFERGGGAKESDSERNIKKVEKIASIFGDTVSKKKEIERKKVIEKGKESRKKVILEKVRKYETERKLEVTNSGKKYSSITESYCPKKETEGKRNKEKKDGDTATKEQRNLDLNYKRKLTFEKGKEISSWKTNEQTDISKYRGSLQYKTFLKRVDLSEKGDTKLKDCTAAIYAARVGGGGEVQRVENKEMNLSKESQNIS